MSDFYSTADMDSLLSLIKKQKPELKDEDIARELGYNEGFIFQNRSRGKVSTKFYDALKRYASNLQNVSGNDQSAATAGTSFAAPEILKAIERLTTTMEKLAESRVIELRSWENMSKGHLLDSETIASMWQAMNSGRHLPTGSIIDPHFMDQSLTVKDNKKAPEGA